MSKYLPVSVSQKCPSGTGFKDWLVELLIIPKKRQAIWAGSLRILPDKSNNDNYLGSWLSKDGLLHFASSGIRHISCYFSWFSLIWRAGKGKGLVFTNTETFFLSECFLCCGNSLVSFHSSENAGCFFQVFCCFYGRGKFLNILTAIFIDITPSFLFVCFKYIS